MKARSIFHLTARLLVLFITVVSVMPVMAQDNPQYALYNYRNDGDFNAWLNIDIDSITYSCIDTLGIEHDDVVVQEVWTPDSVYRIPIEAIDSIGFRAPAPVFKSDVYHITEEHCPYVIDADSLSITFNSNIPFSMLPQRGQIVISDVYGIEPFESGFAGRVKKIINDVSTVRIECGEVSVDDIYNQIICVGRTIAYSSNGSQTRAKKFSINEDGTIGVELLPIKIKLKDPDAESSNMSIDLDITPSMSLDYTIVYNVKGMDNRFKIVAKPQLDFDMDFKYKSTIFGDKILKMEKSFIPIKTTIPGLYAKLKWGGFFDYEGNLSVDGKLSYKSVLNIGYDSAKEDYYGFIFNNDGSGWEEPDVSVSLNGYIFYGPAFQLIACIVSEKWLPSFTITAKPGCKLSGKFEINDDMFTGEGVSVYDAFKNTKVSCSGELSIEGEAKVFSEKISLPSTEWKPDWLKQDFYLYPEFTEADLLDMSEIQGTDYSPSFVYSEVTRNLFLPCKIGMAVYNMEGYKVRENFNDDNYWLERDWSKPLPQKRVNRVGVNMKGLPPNSIYKVCPLVQVKSGLPLFNEIEQASPTTYFQIPLSLRLEQNSLNLGLGEGKEISIFDGWGDFRVINMNPDIVSAQILTHELEGGNMAHGVFVEAKASGRAFVIVQDIRSEEQVTLSVMVGQDVTTLQLSTTSLTLTPGSQGTVDITSGSGSYSIEKIEPTGVVTASISGNTISIEAKTAGTATITVKDDKSGQTATIEVTVLAKDIPAEAIDLGLPSGIKWASYNVGATKPEEYGGYYSWGETEVRDQYYFTTYSLCDGTVSSCHDIGENISGTEYDVAHVKWGGEWCMPTKDDFQELAYNCEYKETSVNGVKGLQFTGPNGQYIFLPYTGYVWNTENDKAGSEGSYWSATQTTSVNKAHEMSFKKGEVLWDCYINRFAGLTVRPVIHSTPALADLTLSSTEPITVKVEDKATVEITSGNGNYTAKSDNEDVAIARVENNATVIIKGISAGSATVTVTDTQSGQTASIEVTVTSDDITQTETFTVNGVSFKMVGVEGGTFWMGANDEDSEASNDERPRHQVTLSSFSIGDTEVTQELWEAVMGNNPSYFKGANHPVEMVNWDDCQAFISKLNAMTGKNFRLPTEAEWEYAASGGIKTKNYKYSGSNDIDAVAWYDKNANSNYVSDWGTRPVAQKQANELGLYDMSGNVWEWCEDWFNGDYYNNSPTFDPCNTSIASYHVFRGGCYNSPSSWFRITERGNYAPVISYGTLGFRLALSDVEGTPQSYLTCPDDHHPHLIDLGLPSGTKWACCNLDDDASKQSPTNYGSYYAWGETKGKDYYVDETYEYYKNGNYVDIGSNIAGTQYDVAHVQWGGSWVMPSQDQIKELLDNCPSEWTTLNGVNGRRFTGNNGGMIFLPAAGIRYEGDLYYAGNQGMFWSSTRDPSRSYGVYELFFSRLSNAKLSYNYGPRSGLSVRPVSK